MYAKIVAGLHRAFENQTMPVSAYLKALTCAMDELLITFWQDSGLAELDTHLLALGGYGRHQLFPHSDVDTLVLLPQLTPAIEEALASFHEKAWDAGIKMHLSHECLNASRTAAEVDLSTQTSWLEARLIVGDPINFNHWHHTVMATLVVDDFIQAKQFEQKQRHIRYEEAEASLEPNIKEHPGGLRDFHTLFWIDRARFGRRSFHTLLAHHGFSTYEIRRLQRAHSLLCTLRAHLHLMAKRQEDTLRYDLHLPLAERLGIHRDASHLHSSERLMQHYYRMSRLILQTNRLILAQLQHPEPPQPPEADTPFFVDNHQLCVRDATCFVEDPALLFNIFVEWQNTPDAQDIHPSTQRAIWEHRHQLDAPAFELRQRLQRAFVAILRGNDRILRSLRYLHNLELLERYLPDWQRIRGQIQHDYVHRYPVDEHNLMVVKYLRRILDPRFQDELPEARPLMEQFKRPEVLWIAGLFHDIGKGLDGDHSQLGAVKARAFAETHQLPEEDIQLIEWLVQEHLTLSQVAQKQDIHNPEVIALFVNKLPSERALVALYLLTIADIRATNPTLWNPWRSHLLHTLFHRAQAALNDYATPPDLLQSIQELVQTLRKNHITHHKPRFWNTLESNYFYRHTPDEMAWHADLLENNLDMTLIQGRHYQGTWQFFIYWPDQSGIFNRLCSFFCARRLSIVEAKIVTSKTGWIFDSYAVLAPDYEWSQEDIEKHCQELRDVLNSPILSTPNRCIGTPRLSRRQQALPLHPEIQLDPDPHHSHRFILHIMAADRPSLWSDIARCVWLSGIAIHDARIQNLGERIEGSLSISGPRLHIPDEQAMLEARLFRLLYLI